jgi:hypothetical protein
MHMLDMIFQHFAVNQNVTQICAPEDLKIWANDFVEVMLKCSRYIHESDGHDLEYKEAILGSYPHFLYILILYPNETIGVPDVDFRDVLYLGQ